jgi:hypothetical protein
MKKLMVAAVALVSPSLVHAGASSRDAVHQCLAGHAEEGYAKGNLAECVRLYGSLPEIGYGPGQRYESHGAAVNADITRATKTAQCLRRHGASSTNVSAKAWVACGLSKAGLEP